MEVSRCGAGGTTVVFGRAPDTTFENVGWAGALCADTTTGALCIAGVALAPATEVTDAAA